MAPVHLRRFLGLALAAVLGLVPLVPAEHVHEVEEHGHLELVVHRHLANHSPFPVAVHHDARQRELDHPDAPIATHGDDYIVPASRHLATASDSVSIALFEPPAIEISAFTGFVEPLSHAPPRGPTFQRGPPSLSSC